MLSGSVGVFGSRVGGYVSLTKPRIIPLLLIVAFASMLVASDGNPRWTAVLATMVGGALAAGGANAINCYLDRDIDGLMKRTRRRAVPSGRVPPRAALLFGSCLGLASFALMALWVNLLAASITLAALLYYVIVYSHLLKMVTVQNIVIGGAAGAAPALVGWAAATNEVGLAALFLFAIVFFWTPPHFWSLALILSDDYKEAGVPMLPAVVGADETKRQILLYTILLVALTIMIVPAAKLGAFYLVAALVLGAIFVCFALNLRRSKGLAAARASFSYSLLYLALLFAAMALDARLSLPT